MFLISDAPKIKNYSNSFIISISSHITIERPIKQIFIWGLMGVGKTSLGKKLASRLNWDFIDLDNFIAEQQKMTIEEIFASKGESEFRKIEQLALQEVFSVNKTVISVGGGTPCFFDNDERMKLSGLCVWLDAPTGMLAQRLLNAKEVRPLVKNLSEERLVAKLDELYALRNANYAKAHMILSVNQMSVQQSVAILETIILDKL